MKLSRLYAGIIGIALLMPLSVAVAADSKSSEPKGATGKSDKLTGGDERFIKEAASGGMMEVELGKVAADKAQNSDVKAFGKRMQDDHSKANQELKTLASNKGVSIPAELDKKHKSQLDKLSKLSGAEFDRQYMKEMVDDHKKDVQEFQRAADKARDADVKKFASDTLPTLKEHLDLAQKTDKQLRSSAKK
ncbi:MAG: DUF4142 domain-containing protein [Pyrinomonadaceae bacterium]